MKNCNYTLNPHDLHNRSQAAPDVALQHRAKGKHFHDAPSFRDHLMPVAQGNNQPPKKLGAYPAPLPADMSHNWGDRHERLGHLRTTNKGHRIGKR